MFPNFLGIGAPKAATTWLFHCLGEHPGIFVAKSKEVTILDYENIDEHLSTYEQHFQGAVDTQMVGEFSTRYLASTRAPARVARLMPNAKLIVSLRQPAEQIYSHYWHLRSQNFHRANISLPPLTLDEAIKNLDRVLVEPAYYFRNISRWLEYFDQSSLHVIFFEDIERDPARVVRELYGFLGVDPTFVPAFCVNGRRPREGASAKGKVSESIHRSVYSALAKFIYKPMKATLGVRRSDRIKSLLKAREVLGYFFYSKGYPQMPQQTKQMLSRHFRSDIEALSELLERRLDHWLIDC